MREILFRGKRTDNDNWTFGYYAEDPQLTDEHGNDSVCIVRINPHPCGYSLVCTPVFPESVGQYTGLTDCNGKKIFEGDILQNKPREFFSKQYRFVVTYDIATFYGKGNFVELCCEDFTKCEIIGNIYDNPELIKRSGQK